MMSLLFLKFAGAGPAARASHPGGESPGTGRPGRGDDAAAVCGAAAGGPPVSWRAPGGPPRPSAWSRRDGLGHHECRVLALLRLDRPAAPAVGQGLRVG